MIAEYGRDAIAEYWQGKITLRKLRVLVEGLPPTSAMHRAAAGHAWQESTYLQAAMVDALHQIVAWQHARRVDRVDYAPPEPIWRPKSAAQIAEELADEARMEAAKADIRRIMRIATGG